MSFVGWFHLLSFTKADGLETNCSFIEEKSKQGHLICILWINVIYFYVKKFLFHAGGTKT